MLSLSLLAACATKDPVSLNYGKRDIGIDDAYLLPADRSVVGITQERASNAMTQKILLSTHAAYPGENYFRVTFFGPVNPEGASENTLSYLPLSDGRISREMRTELPGVAMAKSPYYLQNNYGPFSYASGTTPGGDTCIYGWQQISSPPSAQNFFQNRGRIDLRLRLCETGATPEKLLAAMYDFTINATIAASGWNPYGEPAGPSPDIGRTGSPLMPPAVHSNLSGLFPASDLNTARLNSTLQTIDTPPVARKTTPVAPRNSIEQAPQQQIYAPVAVQPPQPGNYGTVPVVVPQPNNAGAALAPQSNIAPVPSYAMPQPVQVPAPNAIVRSAVPSVSADTTTTKEQPVMVPSPCQLANNSASGHAGNNNPACH